MNISVSSTAAKWHRVVGEVKHALIPYRDGKQQHDAERRQRDGPPRQHARGDAELKYWLRSSAQVTGLESFTKNFSNPVRRTVTWPVLGWRSATGSAA
jgi:hypothetical protein